MNVTKAIYILLYILLTYFAFFSLHAQYDIVKAINITAPTLIKIISIRAKEVYFSNHLISEHFCLLITNSGSLQSR